MPVKNIIHKAEVTEIDNENKETKESYIGLSSTTFKERLGNLILNSFSSPLKKYIWREFLWVKAF